MHIEVWQWIVAGLGAFVIGVSKTGIAGLGILGVAVFALAFPPRDSVGIVLVILICGDVIAVSTGGKHAEWKHLWKLFPWAAAGVVIGAFALGRIQGLAMQHLIGAILLLLVSLQIVRNRMAKTEASGDDENESRLLRFAPFVGLLAGFTTMAANAAGPLMILYLLAMRLPKARFIGTAAWFFLIINVFKVPFSIWQGMIGSASLPVSLNLAPCVVAGAFVGRLVLGHIDQKVFESLALALTFCAAIKLMF